MLSPESKRKFCRCVEEMRRSSKSSQSLGEDLLVRLDAKGLSVVDTDPDLEAMAAALMEAGYTVEPPANA